MRSLSFFYLRLPTMPASPAMTCPKCRAPFQGPAGLADAKELQCPVCAAVFAAGDAPPLTDPTSTASGRLPEARVVDNGRPSLKQERRLSRGWPLAVAAVIGVLVLLAAGAAIAAYVWPGLLLTGVNHGTGDEDPLAYLRADSAAVVGVQTQEMIRVPLVGLMVQQFLDRYEPRPGAGNWRHADRNRVQRPVSPGDPGFR